MNIPTTNKTILVFGNEDAFSTLLVTDFRINKKSMQGWVINGAYWFKWFDNNTAICCDVTQTEIKDKNSWSGYKTVFKPDWKNPVGGIIENVPKPTIVKIYYPGSSDFHYQEIINEARKKFLDPMNYIPIMNKKDLTPTERDDNIPF